jgi:hypothetical protein
MDRHPENRHFLMKTVKTSVVKTRSVDEVRAYLDISHIDLLKIDTQGFDLEVLQGARASINAGRIGAVMVELNYVRIYEGQAKAEFVCGYLEDHGYALVDFYEKYRQDQALAWCTAFFIRRTPL